MLSHRRSAQLGLVSAGLLMLLTIGVLAVQSGRKPDPIAPVFTMKSTDGDMISLESLRGKVVVLAFDSVRCPVSRSYTSRLIKLQDTFAGDDRVRIMKVNSDIHNSEKVAVNEIRHFARTFKLNVPTLIDESNVARQYEVTMTPTFVVVDADGIVRYRGAFDDSQNESLVKKHYCEDAIRNLLEGRSVPVAFTQAFGCPLGQSK